MIEPLLRRLGIHQGIGALLARGAFGSLLVMVAGVGVGFLSQLLLARLLGVSAFGLFVFIITWVRLVGGLGRLGVDTAAMRFVAAYREQRDWARLRGFLGWGRAVTWVAALVAAIPFVMVAFNAATPLEFHAWLLAAVTLPPFVAMLVEGGLLQGLKRPVWAQLGARLLQPSLLLALVLGMSLLLDEVLSAAHAMAAAAAAVAAGWLLTAWLGRRAMPAEVAVASARHEAVQWWPVSLSMLLITAVNLVQTQTDIVMLGLLRDTDLSGIYAAASKVAEVVAFGLVAVNAIAGPLIAGLHARGEHHEIQRLLRFAAWGILAFVLPAVVVLVTLGEWVLSLFGAGFAAGYGALLILMGGQVLNALCGSVGLLLMMTGRQGVVARLMVGTALLNVLLNALLIPPFGLEGAAMATATTTVTWNLALLVLVVRRLGFNPTVLPIAVRPPV